MTDTVLAVAGAPGSPHPAAATTTAGAPGPRRATVTAVAGDGLDALPEPAGGGAGERRGRPRSAAADTAIVETVLRLLEEGATVADLSMERIAREAGVGKATVYRRWSGKPALMLDVMQALDIDTPAPTGTSVRDDLVQMLESMRRRGIAKRQSALVLTVLTQVKAQPELWDAYHTNVIQKRQQVMREILARGMASGEIRADEDVDFVAELFVGPMLSRVLLHEWQELPEGLAERIVDTVLDGVRPRG
ncbi:TetR/AcrR family transcriptional regulator [Streptomyces sp. HSW2009]|uniref:TetR/AcrR family transcriptional regulator n=1 Tax=Streptomyces sp. HSW2009 TaxID=3142890 RepID=UPI0032EAAD41